MQNIVEKYNNIHKIAFFFLSDSYSPNCAAAPIKAYLPGSAQIYENTCSKVFNTCYLAY